MKASWETISSGLDQLWFTPLIENETPDDRAQTVDTFLNANGWNWDDVINHLAKESIDGSDPVCQ